MTHEPHRPTIPRDYPDHMSVQADTRLVRFTPAELVEAVRAGRIRYPNPQRASSTETARVLDGIHRRYPHRSLLLWRDPTSGC